MHRLEYEGPRKIITFTKAKGDTVKSISSPISNARKKLFLGYFFFDQAFRKGKKHSSVSSSSTLPSSLTSHPLNSP